MRDMTTFQKSTLAAGAMAAAILILGWTLPEPGGAVQGNSDPLPGQACTEIGCESGLFVDTAPIARSLPKAKKAQFCIDKVCKSTKLRKDENGFGLFVMKGGKLSDGAGGKVTLRLKVTGRKGRVLRFQKLEVPVVKVQPNGELCPPTCFQVGVDVRGSDGWLLRRPTV